MIKLSVVLLQICAAILIILNTWVPILAYKNTADLDGFMLENERTRMRENYVVQRALTNDIDNDNRGGTYVAEPLDPNTNPDELPALIVDYANMIRNNIILLDNTDETRTKKRNNVKVQRRNKSTLDVKCTCEEENREPIILGDDYFPRSIETMKCNATQCPTSYKCQQRFLSITVLKKKMYKNEESQELLPSELKWWVAVKKTITVGCVCTSDSPITYKSIVD